MRKQTGEHSLICRKCNDIESKNFVSKSVGRFAPAVVAADVTLII